MKHKILVIDDEEGIRKTIRLQLEGTDFEIIEAENGEIGIQVLDNENILEIDVIICDIRMPKINGIEATEIALKKIPGKANSVKIERLGKRNVYAVEIIADEDGGEWDVFVDIETGEIVATDN